MRFFRRNVLRSIQKQLSKYVDKCDRNEGFIHLTGKMNKKEGSIDVSGGIVAGAPITIAKLLIEASKGDEFFAKALITASESMKYNEPEMKKFADNLNTRAQSEIGDSNMDVPTAMNKIKDALSKMLPGAEIISMDPKKVDDMSKDEFDKMIDAIFNATKGNESDGDKE